MPVDASTFRWLKFVWLPSSVIRKISPVCDALPFGWKTTEELLNEAQRYTKAGGSVSVAIIESDPKSNDEADKLAKSAKVVIVLVS